MGSVGGSDVDSSGGQSVHSVVVVTVQKEAEEGPILALCLQPFSSLENQGSRQPKPGPLIRA